MMSTPSSAKWGSIGKEDFGMQKVSIRFFNDREVRAVWDDVESKWWGAMFTGVPLPS